jgi:uncharacterized protein (UPF0371 family)
LKGFDNNKYLEEQTRAIIERARSFGDKLYLEFGGKLLYDHHAARILPGFDPNVKVKLLQSLRDKVDIVICLHAGDIERRKMRADFGITYDADTLKLIDDLRERELDVRAVVVTRYREQAAVRQFINLLERRDITVYRHRPIEGYPDEIDAIMSPEGYGANSYIATEKPIVVVTAPGPGSGKMATCLSQLYHEHSRGVPAGYAKFETFPIWNLSIEHPVNIAYEAATADLLDRNQIDPFHLEHHGQTAVNYNRDIEIFPVVRAMLERVMGAGQVYRSPTEMGVNRAGFAIVDDAACRAAAAQEVVRRFFRYSCEHAIGVADSRTVDRVRVLMERLALNRSDRRVVEPAHLAAREAEQRGGGCEGAYCGAAIELADGRIVTGKNSPLLHATSSLILNALKELAAIPDTIKLLPPNIIEAVGRLKSDLLGMGRLSLDLEETLIALSISATANPAAEMAMEQLAALHGCEMHITHLPPPGDEAGLRRLGVNLTSEPKFAGKALFVD